MSTPLNLSLLKEPLVRVYAVSVKDGSFQWYWSYPAGTAPGPVAVSSGMLYVVAALDNGVYALRASDGKLVWHALPNRWLGPLAVE